MVNKPDIMDRYAKLVEFLGIVMGEDCEVLLQDLRQDKRSVVTITNGHISNRKVGAPITDLMVRVLASGSWRETDYDCNYASVTESGKTLRSSTFYIKDGNELIGLLCINVDGQKFVDLSDLMLRLGGMDKIHAFDKAPETEIETEAAGVGIKENLLDSMEDSIVAVVEDYRALRGNVPVERFSQEDRMEIIRQLELKNIFAVKGAVVFVAEQLCCSEASVYRYLNKVLKNG